MASRMRTSLSRIVPAALVLTSIVLTSCSPRAAPTRAPAPTAVPAVLPAAVPTGAPTPTAAPAAPAAVQTVVVEKQKVAEKAAAPPSTAVVTTPTPRRAIAPTPAATGIPNDWDRIRTAGRLVIGVSPLYRPFAYYNAAAELDGFDVAVVQEIAQRLGLAAVKRDVDPEALMERLRSRQIDLALPSPEDVRPRDDVIFTKPFHICRDVILAGEATGAIDVRTPSDLAGRTVGVLDSSRHAAWAERTLFESGQPAEAGVLTFTLISDLFGALQTGQIDLAIVDAVQATPLLRQQGVRLVGKDLDKQSRSLAVPVGSDRLRGELDRILAEMARDGTLARLSAEYLGIEPADLPALPPPPEQSATPTLMPSPTPTAGPPRRSFVAEPIHIAPGECSRFSWIVEDVRAVYFYARGDSWERSPAVGQEDRTVCPTATTTYELRIVDNVGAVETRAITILVDQQAQLPLSSRLSTTPESSLRLGECLTLTWEVRGNPSRVQVVRDLVALWADAPQAGSLQDCPPAAGTVVYSVLASTPGQTIQTQRVISVNP